MKIKNSNNSISLSKLIPIAFISIIVFSVLRSIQLAKFIDSETGFFIGGDAFNTAFYALLAVVCLVFAIASFLSSQGAMIDLVAFKDKNAGIAAALFSVGLFYDCGDSLVEGARIFYNIPSLSFLNGVDAFKALMSTGALPYILEGIFAFGSAIYAVILAKSFLKGSTSAHNHKLLAIAPIAWAGFKMITRFVKQISYIRVSDLFLELMMLACMLLFFVALSQVISGVYCDDSRWRITALGFSGGVLALCINIPRFIFTFVAKDLINIEYPFNVADAFFGIFAIFVAVAAVKSVDAKKVQ